MNRTHAVTLAAMMMLSATASAAEFHMLHPTRGNMSVGAFTGDGPRLGTMQRAPRRIDFVAHDPETGAYWGQKTSTIGTVVDGKILPVDMPATVDLSHAGGLAFDASRHSILVASRSGAGTVLFEYAPATNAWSEIGNIGRDDFHGLACDAEEGTIYVLDKPHNRRGCTNLRVFNRTGAQVAAIDLSTPIPYFSELRPKLQLAWADGALYAFISYEQQHPRVTDAIYRIDPAGGAVSRAAYNASADVTSMTWPGWEGGPDPSPSMSAAGAQGRGFYSSYRTPTSVVRRQAGELHVVATEAGDTNYLEWLKKVKKVSASSGKNGGMAVAIELDLDAAIQHPVVEVFVEKTEKPVTLALVSGTPVVWSIETAPGASIAKVITYRAPFFSTSQVLGVDPARVDDGGEVAAASAWEMEESSSASRFDEMIATIRDRTALRENSYQGISRAAGFSVPPSDARFVQTPDR